MTATLEAPTQTAGEQMPVSIVSEHLHSLNEQSSPFDVPDIVTLTAANEFMAALPENADGKKVDEHGESLDEELVRTVDREYDPTVWKMSPEDYAQAGNIVKAHGPNRFSPAQRTAFKLFQTSAAAAGKPGTFAAYKTYMSKRIGLHDDLHKQADDKVFEAGLEDRKKAFNDIADALADKLGVDLDNLPEDAQPDSDITPQPDATSRKGLLKQAKSRAKPTRKERKVLKQNTAKAKQNGKPTTRNQVSVRSLIPEQDEGFHKELFAEELADLGIAPTEANMEVYSRREDTAEDDKTKEFIKRVSKATGRAAVAGMLQPTRYVTDLYGVGMNKVANHVAARQIAREAAIDKQTVTTEEEIERELARTEASARIGRFVVASSGEITYESHNPTKRQVKQRAKRKADQFESNLNWHRVMTRRG